MTSTRRRRLLLLPVLLIALAAAGCGDDESGGGATGTGTPTGGESGAGDNVLSIEMKDYAYAIDGEVAPGLVTIESSNTGKEMHMAGFARLKPGTTVDDVADAIRQSGPPGGGGDDEGGPTTSEQSLSVNGEERRIQLAAQATTTTEEEETGGDEGGSVEGGGEEGGGEEGGGGEPLDEFVEEELGTPGHFLTPGASQSITTDVFDEEGTYGIVCFIPTEGSGEPHVVRGMLGIFEVEGEESDAAEPKADTTVTLADNEDPEGIEEEIEAGTHTFEITADGGLSNDFSIAKPDSGKTFEDMDEAFTEFFESEGGPPEGAAEDLPGEIVANTFEIGEDGTIWITVDLEPGEYIALNTTNEENDETTDNYVEFTVS